MTREGAADWYLGGEKARHMEILIYREKEEKPGFFCPTAFQLC